MAWCDPAEAATKLARVRVWMEEAGAPALVVRRLANVAWLTGGCDRSVSWAADLSAITLIITRTMCVAITPDYEYDRVVSEDLAGLDWPIVAYPWEDDTAYTSQIRLICESKSPWSDVSGDPYPLAEPQLRDLRVVLTPREIERYIHLGRVTAEVVQARGHALRQGEREDEIALDLTAALLEHGIMPATILVGADERARRFRHPLPTDVRVQRLALLAVAVRRGGLWVSCTRIVTIGALTDNERRAFQTVVAVDAAYMEGSMTQPTLGDAFHQGMAMYASHGYTLGYRQHHQGGLTGYAAREVRATPTSTYSLKAPMAFAWNPWLDGAKSEDTIITRLDAPPLIITAAPGWPQTLIRTPSGFSVERPAMLER